MKFTINSTKLIKTAKTASGHTGLTAKTRLTTKTTKASLCILTLSAVALAIVFATQAILNTSTASAKRALSDSETRIFAQNNLIGWDPGECSESSSSSGICGDTPKEKYWSYLRQTFDEVHTAAIIGNIDNEGGYGPTRWEIGKVVNTDGGHFIGEYTDWNNLYNCQPCHVGVGAVGITWNLGNYLKYVEKNIPDALPFFKDASYSLPGDQALEKMGSADFDKIVEAEMSWVLEEAKDIIDDFNAITDVREAAKYWAENYEKCQGCLASQGMTATKQKRMDDAEYEYSALKGFVCQNTSSDSEYSATKFSLSDGELYGMIHMAKNEQGSVEGIKFELSIMANKADQAGRSDIVNYIRNSSWFASSTRSSYTTSRGSLSDAEIQAGREVLINGNRSIPSQIVEHDCIGDISWLELDGHKYYASGAGGCRGTGLFKSEYYVSGKTRIHNVYGSTYIFYTFPKSGNINSGDPFGYFENNPPSSATSSSSSSSSSESSSNSQESVSGKNITWIGDSYSVQADNKDLLSKSTQFSGVDIGSGPNNTSTSYIQGSKFVSSGSSSNPSCLSILEKIINANNLRSYLVFACGTNGGWTDSDISKFQELLKDKDTKVVVVTSKIPSNDYADSNNRLKSMVSSNSNMKLADWASVYDASYFASDPEKIHPTTDPGYEKWIGVISSALNDFGGCNSYHGNYPQYWQSNYADSDHENSSQDWTTIPYDGGTVSDSGCGAVSMAMLATVATGKDIYPQDIIDVTKSTGVYVYTSPTVLDPIVGEKYGFEVIGESYSSKTDAYDKIKKYLKDGYMIHFSGEGCHAGFANAYASGGCTAGHYAGIFSISSDDKVQVANSAFMGNSEVDLQSIIDSIHNGVFTAIKGSGNKTTCDDSSCGDNSSSSSVSSGGITEEQAQKIAHYYNTKYTAQGCCGLKNCVELSRFFVDILTNKDASKTSWPNGDQVVGALTSSGLATSGSEPKAWAVFSKISGQHTGVVVGVNSDGTYITIEAAYPGWGDGYMDGNGNGRVYTNKTFTDGTYKFAYFADDLNSTKINEILNN